jgi:hypothetical protein
LVKKALNEPTNEASALSANRGTATAVSRMSSEFPSLSDSTSTSGNVDKSTLLGSSWAEVAQPHEASDTVEGKENNKDPVDHCPGAWEAQKKKATFVDFAGHENKQAEEFPTPQESLAESDTSSEGTNTCPTPSNGGKTSARAALSNISNKPLHNHYLRDKKGKEPIRSAGADFLLLAVSSSSSSSHTSRKRKYSMPHTLSSPKQINIIGYAAVFFRFFFSFFTHTHTQMSCSF